MLIDVGVNLTNKRFDKDRDDLISRAKNQGVEKLLITGTNIHESQQALVLCQYYQHKFPKTLFTTAGIHPHDADGVSKDYLAQLVQLAKEPYVKAIGECGLDFNRNFSEPQQQLKIFKEQISLAAELEMPLFLHQRDAFSPWFEALKPFIDRVPAMIAHCFTGKKVELEQCVEANMYIGITGWLCDERRGKELQEIIKFIPLNRLLIETDAPYLTPRTIRPRPKSSRNEPSYLPYIVQKIAEITAIDPDEIACQTSINARKVFNL
jgi:TatD DNase family protein